MIKIFRPPQPAPVIIQSQVKTIPIRRRHEAIDTISSRHEHANSRSQSENKSLFTRIIDFFDCVQHFCLSQIKKLIRTVLQALQHFTHSTSPLSETLRDLAGITVELEPLRSSIISPTIVEHAPQTRDIIIATENLQDQLFECLRMTEEDMETINYILTTLATANAFNMPSTELREKGKAIQEVHPLKFLSYVINNSLMLTNLSMIKSRLWGIIWTQFIDDLSDKLTETVKGENFEQYIDAFSRSIRRDPHLVREKIAEGSWTKFIDFVTETTSREPSISSHSSVENDLSDTPPSSPNGKMMPHFQSQLQQTAMINPKEQGPTLARHSIVQSALAAPTDIKGNLDVEDTQSNAAFDPESLTQITNPFLLPISAEQKETIEYLLSTVATTNHFLLSFYIIELKHKWKTLKDVNALRILIEIFTDTTNFSNLSLIMQDNLKRKHFLDDLIKVLSKTTPGALAPYVVNFAKPMHVHEQTILPFIMIGDQRSWKNLVKYLYSVKQLPENQEHDSSDIKDDTCFDHL